MIMEMGPLASKKCHQQRPEKTNLWCARSKKSDTFTPEGGLLGIA
jgi:hypothetical protein